MFTSDQLEAAAALQLPKIDTWPPDVLVRFIDGLFDMPRTSWFSETDGYLFAEYDEAMQRQLYKNFPKL